jgi:hypothetical protein
LPRQPATSRPPTDGVTDTETPTAAYLLRSDDARDTADELAEQTGTATWTWVLGQDLPDLPMPASSSGSSDRKYKDL